MRRKIYLKYITLSMGYIAIPILLIAIIAPQVITIYQEQFVIAWVQDEHESRANLSSKSGDLYDKNDYRIYVGLAVGAILVLLGRSVVYIAVVHGAGHKLHNKALFAVLRSPMRFFDTTPIGTIINRFSKDTFFMDERWTSVSHSFICYSSTILAALLLVVVANYWFLIPLVFMSGILIFIVRYYIKTSIELRRIEAVKRSPILSQISSTLAGLATIRAGGQVEVFESQHYELRDDHTKCWMLYHAANHWLAYRLDTLMMGLIAVASFLLVSLRDVVGESVAGLALVHIVKVISVMQWAVRLFTETENTMTAIERIFSFADLPSEAPLQTSGMKVALEGDAPSYHSDNAYGVIEFKNVKLKYDNSEEGAYVLHDVTFKTKPSEKIGIVGRTGAGKSTIFQALLRLYESEGEILLDGRSTKQMGLHELRKSIGVIPQESLLFSETLRINLDPFSEYSDEDLWNALEKVELKRYVEAQQEGLEMTIHEGGNNLSAGQRQLLCLARALLKNCKFLLIDEATANVDKKTDKQIQQTIRETFSDCTVLTIAHRINTIIDSDRIMVIDAGKLVDFEDPAVLLRKQKGIFYDLVKETGMYDERF